MPSRTVHLRLDDWALIGCHDIMQTQGKSVDNLPIATIVRQVINALVRKMQNGGYIPTYSNEERIKRAIELYDGALELDLPFDLNSLVSREESTSDDNILSIVREAVEQIENVDAPTGIGQEVKISEVEPIPHEVVNTQVDLFSQVCTPFSLHQKLQPKDRFIEWAESQNDLVKQAVAVAYTGLPTALWGTDRAEQIIGDLLKNHLPTGDQDGNL